MSCTNRCGTGGGAKGLRKGWKVEGTLRGIGVKPGGKGVKGTELRRD